MSIDLTKVHPCSCTNYNGGACYNCLNGYHPGCNGKGKKACKKKASKQLGLRMVFK